MRAYVIKRDDNSYMSNIGFIDFVQSINLARFFDDYELAECYCLNNYKIVPVEIKEIKQPIRLLPCICGSKKRGLWISSYGGYFYMCKKCKLKTPQVESKYKLNQIWNDMIKEKMKENK